MVIKIMDELLCRFHQAFCFIVLLWQGMVVKIKRFGYVFWGGHIEFWSPNEGPLLPKND